MHVELYKVFVFWNFMRCLSVSIRSMHVELYKIFVFWNMRCLSVSIRSMHVELYKVFWKMRVLEMRCLSVCEY